MTTNTDGSPDRVDAGAEAGDASVTIYEVARRAGVSIATVSHALNRPDRVAAATRARVLQSAEELGFVPRGRGRGRPTLRRIVVTGPLSAHPSYLPRLLGILHAANGVDVTVVDDVVSADGPTLAAIPARGPFDGAILMGAVPDARLAAQLAESGMPVVLLDALHSGFTCVSVNDEAGGALVADHLISTGARTFAWVSPAPATGAAITNGERRARGFLDRLRARGIEAEVPWTVCDDGFEGGVAAAHALCAGAALPDAVFAMHDQLAAGLLAGFRAAGVRVPDDVQLVGYDDLDIALISGLTTVRQPFRESGAAAFESLRTLHRRRDAPAATQLSLMPELVVRETTSAPVDEDAEAPS